MEPDSAEEELVTPEVVLASEREDSLNKLIDKDRQKSKGRRPNTMRTYASRANKFRDLRAAKLGSRSVDLHESGAHTWEVNTIVEYLLEYRDSGNFNPKALAGLKTAMLDHIRAEEVPRVDQIFDESVAAGVFDTTNYPESLTQRELSLGASSKKGFVMFRQLLLLIFKIVFDYYARQPKEGKTADWFLLAVAGALGVMYEEESRPSEVAATSVKEYDHALRTTDWIVWTIKPGNDPSMARSLIIVTSRE
jgi:hypothetical protein